jgi:uncharacterized protein
MKLIHDPAARRFRLPLEDGGEAYLDYVERGPGTLDLRHTSVPSGARDAGVGSEVVAAVLRHASERDLRIVPSCAFVRSYLEEHPEFGGLVA